MYMYLVIVTFKTGIVKEYVKSSYPEALWAMDFLLKNDAKCVIIEDIIKHRQCVMRMAA